MLTPIYGLEALLFPTGDGRVGGRETGDGLMGVAGRWDVGNGHGDGNAVARQAVGELRHGVEVAPDHPCV